MSVEDASIAMCENASLSSISCLDHEKEIDRSIVSRGVPLLDMIAAYMKLGCSTVFVCSNYSTSFKSDDFSSFKEFRQVGEITKK